MIVLLIYVLIIVLIIKLIISRLQSLKHNSLTITTRNGKKIAKRLSSITNNETEYYCGNCGTKINNNSTVCSYCNCQIHVTHDNSNEI